MRLRGEGYMIKIRRGCFETNSSSVHTLTVQKELNIDEDILKSTKELIYPFTEEELESLKYGDELYIFTSIRDKLRYIWTLAIQSHGERKAYKMLKEIFPKVEYIYRPYNYIFEDGEWLFDDDESFSDEWTIEQWKKWFVAGDVVVFSRDLYDRYDDDTLDKAYYNQNEKVKESYRKTQDKNLPTIQVSFLSLLYITKYYLILSDIFIFG